MSDWLLVVATIFGVNLLSRFWSAAVGRRSPALGSLRSRPFHPRDVIGSPLGIALQVAMLAGLVLLLRVDWAARTKPPLRPSTDHVQ